MPYGRVFGKQFLCRYCAALHLTQTECGSTNAGLTAQQALQATSGVGVALQMCKLPFTAVHGGLHIYKAMPASPDVGTVLVGSTDLH